ncbi:hypothetical protein VQ042_23175 [Aurantimonas sp. A2-1-M11]|uniref:hypothetical protein n=1 Tax=Aurantimonas sp. A2-1-M11 TaxID=3113712 RepID=UPI002F94BE55
MFTSLTARRTALAAASFLALAASLGTDAALAQDGATPRAIPEGFVVPGPAPTNAPPADAAEDAETPATNDTAPADPMAFARDGEVGTTDWPCVQRRVATITPAQIWAGPDLSLAETVERTPEMRALIDQVVARRLPLEEAEAMIRDHVAGLPEGERDAAATALFVDILARLNNERTDVMTGIERYGSKQKAFAASLREKSAEFARLQRDPASSNNDIENARQALLWDTRIFDERRNSLTYVCEVPILIERRAFGLGRAIASAL